LSIHTGFNWTIPLHPKNFIAIFQGGVMMPGVNHPQDLPVRDAKRLEITDFIY
jgi:hypothetical protein